MSSNRIQIEPLIVGPLASNCYILWDKELKQGVIIDPGDDAKLILNTVKTLDIEILYIVVTHGHFDHVGAVAELKEELKIDFLAHREDLIIIKDSKDSARRWGIEISQSPNPDRYITDGDKIKFGKLELSVIHTPGHSPGGVSFLIDRILFSGDTLFQGSIGRTDFRKGSFEDLEKSIKTRLYSLPDETVVYTGHGPITTIGDEKRHNAFVRG